MKIIKLFITIISIDLFLLYVIGCNSDNNIKEIMEEYATMNPSKEYLIRFFSIGENNYAELCRIQNVPPLPYDGCIKFKNKTFYFYCVNKCFIPLWIKQHSQICQDIKKSSDWMSEFYTHNSTLYKQEGETFKIVDEQTNIFVTTPQAMALSNVKSKTLNNLLNEYINKHFGFSYYLMFEKIKDKTYLYIGCDEFYDNNILDAYFIRDNHYVFIYNKNVLSSKIELFEESKLLKDKNKIELKAAKGEIIPIFSIIQKYEIVSQETFVKIDNPFAY